MTPREKTVIRAIAKALDDPEDGSAQDMDSFAYGLGAATGPRFFWKLNTKRRAAAILEALADADL